MEFLTAQKQEILDRVHQLFMQVGVRSVTMDDVASELGISKKTLYKHFESKKDLVERSMLLHIKREQASLEAMRIDAENAIDEMLRISRHVNDQLAGLNPATIFDTKKYYPSTWQHFQRYKHAHIYRCICDNLSKGVQEGLYRQEIDPDLLARIYVGRMEIFFDPEIFPPKRYKLTEVYNEFMDYHIRGIASRAGVEYLESRLKRA